VRDLAEMIRKVSGFRGEIRWDTSKPDGAQRKFLDNSRLSALGWRPAVAFTDGIRRTFEASA